VSGDRREAVGATPDVYDVSNVVPVEGLETVRAGSNLLISGPSMTGPTDVALSALARGDRNGEVTVLVAAERPAARVVEEYQRAHGENPGAIYVVDSTGVDSQVDPPGQVVYRSAPDDLTGIGIGLVKATREVGQDAQAGVRVGVLSASTLLRYASTDRVFNFLHVVTGRLAAAGYLGVWTLDPTVHDDQVVNSIRSLFDGVIELRERDDGRLEARVVGVEGASREWTPVDE